MDFKMNKADLLAALEETRSHWEAVDAEAARNFKRTTHEIAVARRAKLRELLKADDATIAAKPNRWHSIFDDNGLDCPVSQVARLESALTRVRNDYRKTLPIDGGSPIAYLLRAYSDASICDIAKGS